ncbi:hypothetical protein HDU96_004931 [Phlyctochytrium bullatum]|nr:hypothetical protein HDU96_004931 [Phlyctochytrium bullatum]
MLALHSLIALLGLFACSTDARILSGARRQGHFRPFLSANSRTAAETCVETWLANDTCVTIANTAGVSLKHLIDLNPGIKCDSLTESDVVCTVGPDDASAITGSGSKVPCTVEYTTLADDTCDALSTAYNLTLDEVKSLNAGLDCSVKPLPSSQLLCLDGYVGSGTHVGGAGSATVPKASPAAGCSVFYTATANLTDCNPVLKAHSISLSSLVRLNTGLKCWNIKKDDKLCVGTPLPNTLFGSTTTGRFTDVPATTLGSSSRSRTATTSSSSSSRATSSASSSHAASSSPSPSPTPTPSPQWTPTPTPTPTPQWTPQPDPPKPEPTPTPAAPPPKPPAFSGSDGSGEAGDAVAAHNGVRSSWGKPGLYWDDGLASGARDFARQLAGNNCALYHNPPSGQGENLFMGYGADYSFYSAVGSWASEGEIAEFRNGGRNHFTQVIWGDTRAVGCGKASGWSGDSTCQIIVCRYSPAGNYPDVQP